MAKKIFADNAVPKELIIPKQDPRCDTDNKDKKPDKKDTKKPDKKEKGKDNKKKTEEEKKKLVAEERNEEEEDEEEEDMKAEETKTTVTATTAASGSDRKEEGSTTTAASSSGDKSSAEEGSIPPEKRCRGTCVTGFFSLLCDEIDRSAVCPASGRCCITRAPPPPKGEERPRPPPQQQQAAAPRPTRPPPPPPAKNSNNRVVQCPGVCIPNVMLGLCAHPSKIVPGTNSCAEGSFCCDHGAQGAGLDRKDVAPPQALPPPPPPPQRPPPQRQPQRPAGPDLTQLLLSVAPTLIGAASGSQSTADTVSSLMPLLAPMLTGMLSGGGGGASRPSSPQRVATSPPQRPPPPTRPTPPPTTTPATTTTTEKPDDREDCPGTCIAPYLSFTCFGNAETTDLFKCAKKRTTCCSPKSAVRELREQLQRANFPPLLGEAGPPGSPQFLLPSSRRNQTVGGSGGGFRRPPPPPAVPAATPSFYEADDTFNDNYYDVSESSEGAAASFPFPVSSGGGALAERPPLQYPVTNKYVCGVKGTYRSGRVVGGEDGVPGEWCWQVIRCK